MIARHSRPPRASTRPASLRAPRTPSMSGRDMHATTRPKEPSPRGRDAASASPQRRPRPVSDSRTECIRAACGKIRAVTAERYVFDFDEEAPGGGEGREVLGGKGVGLAEMTQLGIPVPGGFTITTEACRAYMQEGDMPAGLDDEIERH